jgi:hypothetical protein
MVLQAQKPANRDFCWGAGKCRNTACMKKTKFVTFVSFTNVHTAKPGVLLQDTSQVRYPT